MAQEILIESSSGEKISALVGQPTGSKASDLDKTLILMIHGFPGQKNSHNDFFGDLEAVLDESGFHTARFDFRGCGASDGKSEDFSLLTASEDIQNMILWAKTQGYKRFGFIAEGLGASLALLNMPANMAFMILAWPILDPQAHFKYLQNTQNSTSSKESTISQTLMDSLKGVDTALALAKVNVPVLILHGALDKQVPIEQLEFVRKYFKGPRAEITTFEDGEHGLVAMAHRKMIFHHTRLFAGRYHRRAS